MDTLSTKLANMFITELTCRINNSISKVSIPDQNGNHISETTESSTSVKCNLADQSSTPKTLILDESILKEINNSIIKTKYKSIENFKNVNKITNIYTLKKPPTLLAKGAKRQDKNKLVVFILSENVIFKAEKLCSPWVKCSEKSTEFIGVILSNSNLIYEECVKFCSVVYNLPVQLYSVSEDIFVTSLDGIGELESNSERNLSQEQDSDQIVNKSSINTQTSSTVKSNLATIIASLEYLQGQTNSSPDHIIPQIYSKGLHAEDVFNFYNNRYHKNMSLKNKKPGLIDALLILSRDVDYLSAFQSTKFNCYSDFLYEIDKSFVIDSYSTSTSIENVNEEALAIKSYLNIDQPLEKTKETVINLMKPFKKIQASRQNQTEISDLQETIGVIKQQEELQNSKKLTFDKQKQILSVHTKFLSNIKSIQMDYLFKFEQSLFNNVSGSSESTETSGQLELLSSLISTNMYSFKQLLRIFIILCQIKSISVQNLQRIFSDFINTFGYKVLIILNNYKNLGYFKKSSVFPSSTLSSKSSIFSKLSETLCSPGWRSISNLLDGIPGKTLHLNRISPESDRGVRNVVIVSLGGIRLTEINQLREIAENSVKPKVRFYHVTTGILNSESLL